MGKIQTFLALPFAEKLIFLEAILWLVIVPVLVPTLGLRRMGRLLGTHMDQTPYARITEPVVIRKIIYSVRVASHVLPWNATCLAKAICCKQLLFRQGLESTLYLGVARRTDRSGLKAHAWLRCGTEILTGGQNKDDYTVVSIFGRRGYQEH